MKKLGLHSLCPKLLWMNNIRIRVRFKESCLKGDKVTFTPRNLVNLFIFYELGTQSQGLTADLNFKILFVWSC